MKNLIILFALLLVSINFAYSNEYSENCENKDYEDICPTQCKFLRYDFSPSYDNHCFKLFLCNIRAWDDEKEECISIKEETRSTIIECRNIPPALY